ncbi:MAG: MBOAT family protein [Ruminococcaceae bacterium]|nr:MBOAT family protein [Oscillospiraceae bacterium]
MALISITFVVFLLATSTIYLNLPQRFQNPFLLLSSFVFYAFSTPSYLIVLVATIVLNFYAAILLEKTEKQKTKKFLIAASIVTNLLILVIFKYYNFFGETIRPLVEALGMRFVKLSWAAPLGISYYTLMIIGYLVDIYRGEIESQKGFNGFFIFAVYVSFFPQILAGPINRAKKMLPQFLVRHTFDYGRVVEGMQRILVGTFKKIVLGDGIGIITDIVFSNLGFSENGYYGPILIISQGLYVIRMFADFSGYSDIAIGTAKILGIEMMENFNAPYFAISVNEFWRRWHISLSSWLRDYIYIPLGGNRKGKIRKYFNSMVVYFVCGLWHAPSWNYALWGVSQSLMVILEDNLTKKNLQPAPFGVKEKIIKALKNIYTLAFFYITLLFVSTKDIGDFVYFIKNCFRSIRMDVLKNQLLDLSSNKISVSNLYMMIFWGGLVLASIVVFYLERKTYLSGEAGNTDYNPISSVKKRCRWGLYLLMGITIFFFIMITGSSESAPIYQGF